MGRTPVEASSSESSSGAKVEKEESGRADYVDLQKKLLKGLMGDNSAMIREIQVGGRDGMDGLVCEVDRGKGWGGWVS